MFDSRKYVEEAKEHVDETITLAGWVARTRDLKKIRFIVLRDRTGEIQVVVKPDNKELFELPLGREDVIMVTGKAVTSNVAKAGVEFLPDTLDVINKSIQPLPVDILENKKSDLITRSGLQEPNEQRHIQGPERVIHGVQGVSEQQRLHGVPATLHHR